MQRALDENKNVMYACYVTVFFCERNRVRIHRKIYYACRKSGKLAVDAGALAPRSSCQLLIRVSRVRVPDGALIARNRKVSGIFVREKTRPRRFRGRVQAV